MSGLFTLTGIASVGVLSASVATFLWRLQIETHYVCAGKRAFGSVKLHGECSRGNALMRVVSGLSLTGSYWNATF